MRQQSRRFRNPTRRRTAGRRITRSTIARSSMAEAAKVTLDPAWPRGERGTRIGEAPQASSTTTQPLA